MRSSPPTGSEETLRLDLYLARSRLVRRRTLASLLCRNGWVEMNGRLAAPGKGVRPGDRISLTFPREILLVEVVSLPSRGRRMTGDCYRVVERKRIEGSER